MRSSGAATTKEAIASRCCAMLAAALLFSACGAKQMYPGPELPDDSVAIVTGSRTVAGIRIYFVGYDEGGEESPVYKIEIPAGERELKVHVTAPSGSYYRLARTISFYARGGHTYQVKGVEWDDKIWIWIEDTYTHEIVGGEKP
jgi:hypothetical protein